jgi:hypothetical protein
MAAMRLALTSPMHHPLFTSEAQWQLHQTLQKPQDLHPPLRLQFHRKNQIPSCILLIAAHEASLPAEWVAGGADDVLVEACFFVGRDRRCSMDALR